MKFIFIVLMSVGVVLLLVGLIIRISKKIEIINQVNEKKKYDKDGLASFFGNHLIIMGVLEVLVGGIAFLQKESRLVSLGTSIVSFLIILFFSIKAAVGVIRFEIEN